MSSKYKIVDDQIPHFVTSTVVGWVDALSREMYKEIICKSLRYCIDNKGLLLHAWVIMPNHFYLIVSCQSGNTLQGIMRDLKKYTSRQIVKAITEHDHETRREWMLNMFRYAASANTSTEEYQFWQHDYHPIALIDP